MLPAPAAAYRNRQDRRTRPRRSKRSRTARYPAGTLERSPVRAMLSGSAAAARIAQAQPGGASSLAEGFVR